MLFNITQKQCSRCGEWKSFSEFYKCPRSKDGYLWFCKSCNKAKQDKWRSENLEKARGYVRSYRSKNREAVRERDRIVHRERYAKDPDKYRAINKKWVDAHLDKKIAINNNRRSREKNSTGKITAAEWAGVLEKYNHKCLRCGVTGVRLTRDHVIPLELGGTNTVGNIQPLCQSCNSKKGIRVEDYR
jgi:5-methylcytosine-specific restriction endonuclease McrA